MSIKKYIEKNTSSLRGKKIAITGSTGGLGYEVSEYLCSLGASLILVDRNKGKSEANMKRLSSLYHTSVKHITADLEDISSVKAATEQLKNENIDIFIHNAGAYSIPRHKCTSGYDNVFQMNFASPYYMIRELLPELRERQGKVIAVGSIAHNYSKTDPSDMDFSTRSQASKVYGNAKKYLMFSLYGLFENEKDVKLSIVHPGITFTNITAHYPKLIFAIIKHPMKVIFMKPKKAALCLLQGVFDSTEGCKWIGPRFFSIWGYPKKSILKTCSENERCRIAKDAEKVYENLQNTV